MRNLKHTTVLALALALSSCGKQQFEVVQSQSNADAPGSFTVPSKVDIVLAVDDSGSALAIDSALNAQLQSFVSTLQSQSWDYRVTTIPLVAGGDFNQVACSNYDSHWGSQWKQPYPNAPQSSLTGGFVQQLQFSPAGHGGGAEYGLQNIQNALSHDVNSFVRSDAMLVVIIIGNGDDADGYSISGQRPILQDPNAINPILNTIRSAHPALRLYSMVAQQTNCLGGNAYIGQNYMNAANRIGGGVYNLCAGDFSGLFASLSTDLQGQRKSYKTINLFMNVQPNVSSIQVFRKSAGGGETLLPQSNGSSYGWVYRGYENNVPEVIYQPVDGQGNPVGSPIAMNTRSGYTIQLVGGAELSGSDSARVVFTPYGVQASK